MKARKAGRRSHKDEVRQEETGRHMRAGWWMRPAHRKAMSVEAVQGGRQEVRQAG